MKYLDLAMNAAQSLGAEYADIRIQKTTDQMIYLRNLSLKSANTRIIDGYGIRVFKDGAWGFAHNNVYTDEAVLATVQKAFDIAALSASVNKNKKLRLAVIRVESYDLLRVIPRVLKVAVSKEPFSFFQVFAYKLRVRGSGRLVFYRLRRFSCVGNEHPLAAFRVIYIPVSAFSGQVERSLTAFAYPGPKIRVILRRTAGHTASLVKNENGKHRRGQ